MEELGFENIWGEKEVENLFTDPENNAPEEQEEKDDNPDNEKEKEKTEYSGWGF